MISISFDVDEYYDLVSAVSCAIESACDGLCDPDDDSSHCDTCARFNRLYARLRTYESTFNS